MRKTNDRNQLKGLAGVLLCSLLVACSSTSALPDGEQLFAGLKKIEYKDMDKTPYATSTREEMESVLASAPNGALMGSSYYRTPFPFRLWIWNAFSQKPGKVAQWITRSFGSTPKLMRNVNPQLRALVAENQLRKYGYFNGNVDYRTVTLRNPKEAKVAYTVTMGHLWTIDSLRYIGFHILAYSLLDAHAQEAVVRNGDPFCVPNLEAERQRVTALFRNHGYYYYQNGYSSYVADTLQVPGKALLRFVLADSIDERARQQWYIGKIDVNFRTQVREQLTDSLERRSFTIHFNGHRPPIRPGIISRGLKFHPRQLYSAETETLSRKYFQGTGLFSSSTLSFTPRDSCQTCDTLDLALDLVMDRPYDFYIEANGKGKTTGRMGPEVVMGLTKRNAFRGGEKLDFNVHGSYEWQTGHTDENTHTGVNSYEYGGDLALVMPRLMTPASLFRSFSSERERRHRHRRRVYEGTPTTTIKASMNVLNRASYFKRHVVSGELTYDWMPTAQSHFSFTPISISYEYMNSQTAKFDSLLQNNPYLQISMRDQLVPKMSFSYTYTSAASYLNPITWSTTVSEAGNLLSLGYMAAGKQWNAKNKQLFKNPYAQFLKIETDLVKLWKLSDHSSLVGHLNSGVIWSYGNAEQAPYYEQFYVGGANSIRAFNVRSIGPGKFVPTNSKYSYIDQTGDVKFLANLEYRPRLVGDLYGALFLDAGNVWSLKEDDQRGGGNFEFSHFLKQMALGTGVGLRFDMGMFVIRLDWGIGLHLPYDTERTGFYNVTHFKDAQSIHLAVGYPF